MRVCVNQLDVSPFVLLLFGDVNASGASLFASLPSFDHLVSQTRGYFSVSGELVWES